MWTINQFDQFESTSNLINLSLLQIKLLQGAANAYTIERDSKFSKWFDSILIMDEREAHELSCQVKTLKSNVWEIQFDSGGAATDRGEQQQRVEVETHPSHLIIRFWSSTELTRVWPDQPLHTTKRKASEQLKTKLSSSESCQLQRILSLHILPLFRAAPPTNLSLSAKNVFPHPRCSRAAAIPLFHQLCTPTTPLKSLLEPDPPIHLSSPILLIHFSISFPPDSEDGSPRLQTTERMTPLPAR